MYILRFIAFLICFIAIHAQESFNGQNDNMRKRQTSQSKLSMDSESRTSYVYPLEPNTGMMFLEIDYIYWKPTARIPYATTMDIVTTRNLFANSFRFSTNRTIERVNLKPKSGFKVELGSYLPPYGWLTSGEYTFLKGKNSSSATGEERNTVPDANAAKDINAIWRTVPLGDNNGDPERLTNAQARQRLSYQIFDWILQKTLFWKEKFGFSPYFGIRGAWIKNKLNVTYNGTRTHDSNGPLPIEDKTSIQSNYRAGGLRVGLKSNWILGYGLEIFSNASMSLVYGKHDIRQKEDFQRRLGISTDQNNLLRGSTTSHNDWNALRSAFQLVFGMDWGRNFCKDSLFFGLKVAYEVNLWPNVIQLRKLMRDARVDSTGQPPNLGSNTTNDPLQDFNRSLGLHGLTLGVRLDF